MTRKDFVTVAKALQGIESSSDRWLTTNLIADSLAAAYPKFDTDKFIQYAMEWPGQPSVQTSRVGLEEILQNNRNKNNS